MTAEIAILNKSAVALAADSAVTLGVRGQQKIYNSVDKLFQLLNSEPVGIMVFGNAEYMGVPIETVIKQYRSSNYANPKEYLKDYSDSFFEFLKKEIPVPQSHIDSNIQNLVYGLLDGIKNKALKDFVDLASEGLHNISDPNIFIETQIINSAKAVTANRLKKPDNKYVTEQDISDNHSELINSVITEIYPDFISDSTRKILLDLGIITLKKDIFSQSCAGLVIAGFGTKEIFPTMQAFNSDGLIGGTIKRKETQYIDIDRDGTSAHIEPFAQKEMVERFLDGIDPSYESYIQSAMQQALNELGEAIVTQYVKGTKKKKAEINALVKTVSQRYMTGFKKQSTDRKENNFRQKILDMVVYMPKSDLANMAESLINLTSTKRKVSAESETVGGPVDVAVISKHDGFVWIKRKHYFNPELNPRYFINQRANLSGGGPNGTNV